MTEEEYMDRIREICKKNEVKKVVLFGSRAKGLSRPNSDFDIAVWGSSDVENIREELDNLPTLYSADVVDMDTCSNPHLIREVEEYGIQI